jgi:DNA-binding NtrC family response regulator
MTRILIIEPSPALRKTVAQLLEREYQVDQRDSFLDPVALGDAAAYADVVISSAGPAPWTAALARLNTAVLLLVESGASVESLSAQENFSFLRQPFNPYEFKALVKSLVNKPRRTRPGGAVAPDYLDFPYLSHGATRLARRFESLSLPVLVWGERGCGQDRVARALLREQAYAGALVTLNGADLAADDLKGQQEQLAALGKLRDAHSALLIEGLDRMAPSAQSLLLNTIDAIAGRGRRVRLVSTANVDLLERVYRGEFLERLYYRLAKLTLPLAPLRQRRGDLPALARRLAADYLADVHLSEIEFTPAALARLEDYLWFGNLDELDLVVARTLAIHGKPRIDAADLVFDVSTLVNGTDVEPADTVPASSGGHEPVKEESSRAVADAQVAGAQNGPAAGSHLRLLVHELAHELKNPMVTIKTFAQLLAERYDDASFRARFQDVVDGDIERMDELLGVMAEYAGFEQPRKASTVLMEILNSTLAAIQDDCAKRQLHVGWNGNGQAVKIMADPAQLRYALKNTLLAVLSQAKAGSKVEVSIAESGALVVSYLREGERIQSLANYFNNGDVPGTNHMVPLRMLLAREIVERSGGRFDINERDANRDIVTLEFPVV